MQWGSLATQTIHKYHYHLVLHWPAPYCMLIMTVSCHWRGRGLGLSSQAA